MNNTYSVRYKQDLISVGDHIYLLIAVTGTVEESQEQGLIDRVDLSGGIVSKNDILAIGSWNVASQHGRPPFGTLSCVEIERVECRKGSIWRQKATCDSDWIRSRILLTLTGLLGQCKRGGQEEQNCCQADHGNFQSTGPFVPPRTVEHASSPSKVA